MGDNIEYRVEQLETKMLDMGTDVKQIMTNHLPHIEKEIVKFSTAMKIYGALILAGISALIVMGLGA